MESEYKKVPIEEIEKSTEIDKEEPTKYGYGIRHVQALLCFMCISLGYISRGHLGVTIVAMTMVRHENNLMDTEAVLDVVNNTITDFNSTEGLIKNLTVVNSFNNSMIVVDNKTEVDPSNGFETYDWPKSTQETVLGSFFLGYSIMMFPIGLVCQRWGGKIPLQVAMFVNAAVSFLGPWFVSWGGWKALSALRVLQGLSQAGLYPASNTILANWIPISERGTISSYVFAASGIGTVIAFQSAGILASSRFGWPSAFWASGAACFVGFILITVFGAKTPKDHKSVTEAEKIYIMGKGGKGTETKAKVPWKLVLRSVPVWVVFISHIGNAVSFVFFLMQVPTYMYAVLKFNIRNSGILSSLPYLMFCLASVTFGSLSDYLTNRKIISVKTARKGFNIIGTVIPAFCLILVAYTANTILAVVCLIMFLATNSAINTGWMLNYIDLSPNYSGALLATGNAMANILVLALPVLISNIIIDVTDQYQWRITLLLMAAVTVVPNFLFIFFMSAEVQPWNDGIDTVDKKDYTEHLKPEDIKLQSKNEDGHD